MGSCRLGQRARNDFFFVREQAGFDDHLDERAFDALDDFADIILNERIILALERADVEHHVDFDGAASHGFLSFKHL